MHDIIYTFFQTIKSADIATVRKLAKPPHLIMRVMDCVLILFQKRVDNVSIDPERQCLKPSWGEALKVTSLGFIHLQLYTEPSVNTVVLF